MRQDDIWMLDGDDPQEPMCRASRPEHLDFLRITPPEDDIIGETPYCPKLERMVRANVSHKTHETACFFKLPESQQLETLLFLLLVGLWGFLCTRAFNHLIVMD